MRDTRLALIAALFLAGLPAAMSGLPAGPQTGDAQTAAQVEDSAQTEVAANELLCAAEDPRQGFSMTWESSILDDLAPSGFDNIICRIPSCECFECGGGICVPVPPPPWCQPIPFSDLH